MTLAPSIALLWIAAVFAGRVAKSIGLPGVLGELLVGVALGPTLLGIVAPEIQRWLFPTDGAIAAGRDFVAKIGLFGFLFAAGLEVDIPSLRGRQRLVVWISFLGILIPFALGFASVHLFPGFWEEHAVLGLGSLAFFVGLALSISALPVIARILMDLGVPMMGFGSLVLAAAVIDDVVGWAFFSVLLAATPGGVNLGGHWAPAAFMIGAAVSSLRGIFKRPMPKTAFLKFLAPVYFASVGLKTNFVNHFDLSLCAVVMAIACLGKLTGARLGAWCGGMPRREAWAVGFALNARGAMEVVLASLALSAGLINEKLFVALVIMGFATSLLSGPAIRWLILKERSVEEMGTRLDRPYVINAVCAAERTRCLRWKIPPDGSA